MASSNSNSSNSSSSNGSISSSIVVADWPCFGRQGSAKTRTKQGLWHATSLWSEARRGEHSPVASLSLELFNPRRHRAQRRESDFTYHICKKMNIRVVATTNHNVRNSVAQTDKGSPRRRATDLSLKIGKRATSVWYATSMWREVGREHARPFAPSFSGCSIRSTSYHM